MRRGGEPLQQEFNRGYDFILNTYGAAQGTMPSKNSQIILVKGIVIDIDFNIDKNYKLSNEQAPFSIYAKIIGEDLDTPHPEYAAEKIYFSPLIPIHNLSIPEIGEEILIMRESTETSSKGYYIGRISNTSILNYYPARQYMDSVSEGITSGPFKYGFSFDIESIRNQKIRETPSADFQALSIPVTFGDVVQQGRSQSYIRHSFNRVNKKGVLEQGLLFPGQNSSAFIKNTVRENADESYDQDPSIGETATKNIHFIDSSIQKLGDYQLASVLSDDPIQGNIDGPDKSIMANLAEEIYNISTKETGTGVYRQVLGEKLILHQRETNVLLQSMLDGLTGLAQTTQLLLDAFVDHTHALPKIDLNLEKEIKSKDLYRTAPRFIKQPDQIVRTPSRQIRIQAGFKKGGYRNLEDVPVYTTVNIPGSVTTIKRPPRIIPGKIKVRNIKQKINFEAIIGGATNPRFTAAIQTDIDIEESSTQSTKTEVGMKTAEVNNNSEQLINSFNEQKEKLNNIVDKATNFLSRNQFIN
jgi:hypothetical protein